MDRIASYLLNAVEHLGAVRGGLGLFFVAFCDSSFLSLPEINDILILYFCTRYKERAIYYILMATLGSATGCLALYGLGRWKGYGFLHRRYGRTRLESVMKVFQRYGMLAVIGPALMPPPFPFKIFVLSSGVFGLSLPRFIAAVLLGRGFRYSVEGALAVRYGDQAVDHFKENYPQLAVAALLILLAALVTWLAATRLRRRRARAA